VIEFLIEPREFPSESTHLGKPFGMDLVCFLEQGFDWPLIFPDLSYGTRRSRHDRFHAIGCFAICIKHCRGQCDCMAAAVHVQRS
jgi:hypothetical protein